MDEATARDEPSIETTPWWWSGLASEARWLGVFQGGGARGVAYAGALAAVKARHQWFRAVAGSSAGAITASLVAAGYAPEEMGAMTRRLLSAVRPDGAVSRLVNRWPTHLLVRYDATELECRLDELLRAAVERFGSLAEGPVTFRMLQEAASDCGRRTVDAIRLYVIALDATAGRPMPFCAELTGDLPVASAVVASCAIPIAFSPRYAEIDAGAYGGLGARPPFRQLVDGGAWANFPAFVFSDVHFRNHHGLATTEGRMLGFTLSELRIEGPAKRFVEDPRRHVRKDLAPLLLSKPTANGARCVECMSPAPGGQRFQEADEERSGLARRLLAIGTDSASWIVQLLAFGGVAALSGFGGWQLVAGNGAAARTGGIALLLVSVALLGVLGAVRRLLASTVVTGLPTLRAMLGQATAPPVWVGLTEDSAIVFVPSPGIETTDFRVSDEAVRCAIGLAQQETLLQLDSILSHGVTFAAANLASFRRTAKETGLANQFRALTDLVPTHEIRSRNGH